VGVRRRFAPHQLQHAHAVELAREGVPLIVIQRQLGHTNLGITSIYLQGIEPRSSKPSMPAAPNDPSQRIAPALINSGLPAQLVAAKRQRRGDGRQSAGRCAAQRSRGHDRAAR
jgi:hypothetical protein